ncbi:hypothetical protein [Streptomyces solicathayae]|uniref:Lipoprotein n=1 Tax=Streptomyces solicathayae TaxID=3081768 RepID=A0ABZ0LS65_9ACTN|nr:hypothetical protein [Streptomyces sp. HUAS YS2]WOX22332.1 hypothetical protein R2D22_13385 [Streptomyces sp. HUAS YS2]
MTRRGIARITTATVVAALTLGLTTACEGDEGKKDEGKSVVEKKPTPSTSAPAGPGPEPYAPAPTGKPLAKPELEKAVLVAADVPGFNVGPMDAPPPQGETPEKPECAPLTSVLNGQPEPAAQASVYRQITGANKDLKPAVSVFLTSHGPSATTVLHRLRVAATACKGGFTTRSSSGPSTYKGVKELTMPRAGDDSFAYQLTGDFEGTPVPLVFQVVRQGPTVATFYTANFEGPATPQIPPALAAAQVAKLKE